MTTDSNTDKLLVLFVLASTLLFAGVQTHADILLPAGAPNPNHGTFYAWFDAAYGVLGEVPADNTLVDWWMDRTFNGHDIYRVNVQADRWPTFKRSIAPGGQHAVRFDGNDYIWGDRTSEFGTIDLDTTTGRTYFIVAQVRSNNAYLFDSSSSSGRNALIAGQTGNPNAWWVYSGSVLTEGSVLDLNSWMIHTVTFDLATDTMQHYINGTLVTTDTAAPLSQMSGLVLGARYSLSHFLDGDISELMVYDELLSTTDRQSVETYLLDKFFAGNIPPAQTLTQSVVEVPLASGTTCASIATVSDPETPVSGLTVWISDGNTADLTVSVDSVDPTTGLVTLQIQTTTSLAEGTYQVELSTTDGTHTVADTFEIVAYGPVINAGLPSITFPYIYAWYDASDGVNGSGTPADGTLVTSWLDRTGNGRDMIGVDSDTDLRPTYAVGTANGQNAVRFDGNDYIYSTANEFGTIETSGRTFFLVIRVKTTARNYAFDSASSSGRNALIVGQTADPDVWWPYPGEGSGIESAPIDYRLQYHAITFNGDNGDITHYIDGQLVSSGNDPLHDMVGLTLGARYGHTNGLDGDIAEFIVYSSVLNDTDRQSVEAYLADKYEPVDILSAGEPNTSYTGLYAWYDAADGVNGSGAPADGTSVTSWEDQSGNGRTLDHVGTSGLPIFKASVANGLPAVEFDGSVYIWGGSTASGFGSMAGEKTIFWVSRQDCINRYIFDGVKSVGRNAVITGQGTSPGAWNLFSGYSPATVGPAVDTGILQVHAVVIKDGYNEHFINGTSVASGTSQMAPLKGLVLGARYTLEQNLDGEIAEFLVYSGALTEQERQAVEGYLLAKHPVTEPLWQPIEFIDVYTNNEDGYPQYRIPSILTTTSGTLLAFCEARQDGDHSENDIVVKRSTDGGRTWGPLVLIQDAGADSLNDPLAVQVKTGPNAGRVYLHYMRFPEGCHTNCVNVGYGTDSSHNYLVYSDDDGITWQGPFDVTTQFRPAASSFAGSPGIGIQKRRAPHAGRIVMPIRLRLGPSGDVLNYAVYSDDGGASWTWGQTIDESAVDGGADENQLVELSDGTLMMNARQSDTSLNNRKIAYSYDGGETWTQLADDDELKVTKVMASIIRYTDPLDGFDSRILFTSSSESGRSNGTVRLSYDEGNTWPVQRVLYPDTYAYSCLTVLDDYTAGSFFERSGYEHITLARFSLRWLTSGADLLPCPGDLDDDGDVDLADFAIMSSCIAGPNESSLPSGCTQQQFNDSDFDGDGDVDLQDFAEFQAGFARPCL